MLKSKKYLRTITIIPDDLWNEIKNILPDEKSENIIDRKKTIEIIVQFTYENGSVGFEFPL
jgi:hypothetical protein